MTVHLARSIFGIRSGARSPTPRAFAQGNSRRRRSMWAKPLLVVADHTQVRQVLFNLLSNASKFTPEEALFRCPQCGRPSPFRFRRSGPARRPAWYPGTRCGSRCVTAASASVPRTCTSFSRSSARPTTPPAGSSKAPASAWPSASSCGDARRGNRGGVDCRWGQYLLVHSSGRGPAPAPHLILRHLAASAASALACRWE